MDPTYPASLPRQSRKLSGAELGRARRICAEMTSAVIGRPQYLRQHAIDERFALPDSNWSYDSAHAFVRTFKRVAGAATPDLNLLRGFTWMFSGYNLFEVMHSRDLQNELSVDGDVDTRVAQGLAARNATHVQQHRQLTAGIPAECVFRPPAMFGEAGHLVDGVLVNHDTNVYQERINLLHRSGVLGQLKQKLQASRDVRICEIGGGYGALCHWFMQTFPGVSYTIVDLPESLLFSRLYVSLTLPDTPTSLGLDEAPAGVRFLPNFMAEELDDSFDLVINTLSMSEMTEHQVLKYAHLMRRRWLKPDGIFFEQNQDNRHGGMLFAQEVLAGVFDYHYPLYSDTLRHSQGFASLWSVNPLD